MKLYTLSTFECQNYTTANWFFATSREKAEFLTEQAVAKAIIARCKLRRKEKLWEKLWSDYNDKSELNELCKKHNVGSETVLRIKHREEYNAYYKKRDDMRKQIQNRLVWKMLCKIEYHYSIYNRDELIEANLQDLKDRIIEIEADSILPLIQKDGD